MQAKIITIGDELLIGQVIDSNSAWIGAALEGINIKVTEIRSIEDTEEAIIENLEDITSKTDIIILTGGLGPTKDDVTKKSIAKFLGVELVWNEDIFTWIKKLFGKFNIDLKESHRSQAYMPEGAKIIANKMGTAQGMWMEKNGKIYISMPGVPFEMKYIMENGVLQDLIKLNSTSRIFHKTIMTAGWGETMIEEKISDIINTLPSHLKIAYLPGLGRVRVRLSSQASNAQEVQKYSDEITKSLGDIVYGYDNESLEQIVGRQLTEANLKLGTAESCTGGHLAHTITSVPGSSAYYQGSIIAYANKVKQEQLQVREETLKSYGAVSEDVVKQMVEGLIDKLGVDIGISTSGIAGPGGGTPEKPVGTIWIAVGNKDRIITRKLTLTKNRLKNIEYTTFAALNMLRKFLLGG